MSPRRRARSETPESDFEWSQVLKKGFTTSPRQYPRKQTRSTLKIEDQSPSKKRGLVTPPTQSPSKKTGFTTPLTPSPTKRNRSVLDHEYQPPAKRIRLALAAEKEDADHWRKYGPHSGTYRYVRSFSFKQNVPMPQYRLTGENQKAWQTAMGAFYAKANKDEVVFSVEDLKKIDEKKEAQKKLDEEFERTEKLNLERFKKSLESL